MLALRKAETQTLSVLGVDWTFAPISWPMVRRARKAARLARGEGEVPDDDADEMLASMGDAISLALLTEGLIGWGEGQVADEDGEAIPYSIEAKRVALADPAIFEALDNAYVVPFSARQLEGNGSAPSRNGTGGAPIREKPTAAIARRRKAAGAKPARTKPARR